MNRVAGGRRMASKRTLTCISDGSWLSIDPDSPCSDCRTGEKKSCSFLRADTPLQFHAMAQRSVGLEDETLFHQDDPADKVYVVVSGMLRCSKYLPDGRRHISGFLGPGDLIGVVSEPVHEYTAEFVTDTEVCAFPRGVFDALVKADSNLDRQIYGIVATELMEARAHARVLSQQSSKARVAAFFKMMHVRQVRREGPTTCLDLPMNRRDISDYLGVAYETLSRLIQSMQEEGMIKLDGLHRVCLEQKGAIDELAGGALDGFSIYRDS